MPTDDVLKNEFKTIILPMYKKLYPKSPMPAELEVWPGDQVDGGAVQGLVYVTEAVGKQLRAIRLYAMAHESGHVATVEQATILGLGTSIPGAGAIVYKKSEYLADLIGLHTIRRCDSQLAETIRGYFSQINTLLGNGDDMHPSGDKRVALMTEYMVNATAPAVTSSSAQGLNAAVKNAESASQTFGQIFRRIWAATVLD